MKMKMFLDDDYPKTLMRMHNLVEMYRQKGIATNIYEELLSKKKKIFSDDHSEMLESMYMLTWTYEEQGQFTKAVKLHKEMLAKNNVIFHNDHLETLESMCLLAYMYKQLNKFTEATKI